MEYKGYKIIAQVHVTQEWEFREEDGRLYLHCLVWEGEAHADSIEGFLIYNKNGEQVSVFSQTLAKAKQIIDNLTAVKTSDGHRVRIEVK